MTNIPKIGVNPRSQFATPMGIYAYPLDEPTIINDITKAAEINPLTNKSGTGGLNNLPYAGYQRFANLLFAQLEERRTLSEYTPEGHVSELIEIILRDYGFPMERYDRLVTAADMRSRCVGGHGYCLTMLCAYYIGLNKRGDRKNAVYRVTERDFDETVFTDVRGPIIWNGILRRLGFDAVRDYGSGFVHVNEPIQVCFLDTRPIVDVKRFVNNSSVYTPRSDITSFKQFRQLIKAGKIGVNDAMAVMQSMYTGRDVGYGIEFQPVQGLKPSRAECRALYDEFMLRYPSQVEQFYQDHSYDDSFLHWIGISR